MGQWLEVLAGGITQGAIYCVFAFGLSLVYGTTRIMNFAHGSFYMVGGYLAWVLSVGYFGFSYPVVFLIAVPLLFLIGVAVERVVIRPLRWTPNWKTSTMMATPRARIRHRQSQLDHLRPGREAASATRRRNRIDWAASSSPITRFWCAPWRSGSWLRLTYS